MITEVKELQRFNSQELSKLLKDSENFSLIHLTANGLSLQIDMDKLVRILPPHLTAVLLSSQGDEASLKYLLSGLRLLYSLCEIATRHSKLEQILLDDLRVSEQLLDLGYSFSGGMPLIYSALVACSMYLITACISSQWSELIYVLQAHPKVDIFIDAAFGAVRMNINCLQIKLSAEENEFHSNSSLGAEKAVNFCWQQCEASLQFVQSLCQNKSFRERLLRNKELCGKGGILRLVQATLKLNISPFLKEPLAVIAAVSRLKARVLSILLHLCESESVSFLDEVASIPESLELAKCVAVEVITLLKTMLSRDLKLLVNHSGKIYPRGLLQLNALRLTDIFSDDSNFRSYITTYFAEVLAAILSIPYQQFLAGWCSSDLPLKEEDASLEYEPFIMAGWILDSSSTLDTINVKTYESNFIPTNNAQASYAHQRTSLLVKVISNLHCFVPKICKEQERNLFLHKFLERLKMDWHDPEAGFEFNSAPEKAATICKNLRSLLGHAESLIPTFLNEEDVQLLRLFFTQLQSLIGPVEYEVNRGLELQSSRGCTASLQENVDFDHKTRHSNLREGMSENSAFPGVDNSCINGEATAEADGATHDQKTCEGKSIKALAECIVETEKEIHNEETSGSDSSTTRGQNPNDKVGDGEYTKPNEHFHRSVVGGVQQDERVESVFGGEKQVRKRKRHIMNDKQISLIERGLLDEPDIHKNLASLQSWADRLSLHGSEVTCSQLKNWLNNRRAKLARAAKDGHPLSEENAITDTQVGPLVQTTSDSPESRMEDLPASAAANDHSQVPTVLSTSSGININPSLEAANPESSSRLSVENEGLATDTSCVNFLAGQAVVLTDTLGKEIAKGTVYQVEGEWHGCNLSDTRTCVVDITELRSERIVRLPHPSIEAGATFEQAEVKIGTMRVLWDSGRMLKL
ncbi:nodulin homeobox-like isoform X2 [Chenopodium quinoa]|uniref:nodulin homeobox-like isoform X2 n=1 Tax=Chenopodium quinoa TaxID=63459 RepID=UPI000B795F38|nr:nodulin homeobox-like isoform X2 [Chenopodium quinoa]